MSSSNRDTSKQGTPPRPSKKKRVHSPTAPPPPPPPRLEAGERDRIAAGKAPKAPVPSRVQHNSSPLSVSGSRSGSSSAEGHGSGFSSSGSHNPTSAPDWGARVDVLTKELRSLILSERDRKKKEWRSRERKDRARILEGYMQVLALPRTLPNYESSSDVSTRIVEWVSGKRVNGRVVFEAWRGFDKLATEAWGRMLELRKEDRGIWKDMEHDFESACRAVLQQERENEASIVQCVNAVVNAVVGATEVLADKEIQGYVRTLTHEPERSIATERLPDGDKYSHPASLKPDISLFKDLDTARQRSSLPLATIEVKSARSVLVQRRSAGRGIGPALSSQEFIEDLNRKFASSDTLSGAVAQRMGQAVSEAVLTSGGYAMLTNFNKALFLRVRKGVSKGDGATAGGSKDAGRSKSGIPRHPTGQSRDTGSSSRGGAEKVVVEVSRQFECDAVKEAGTFPAMVAFCREAISAAEDAERKKEMRACVAIIAGLKKKDAGKEDGGTRTGGDGSNQGGGEGTGERRDRRGGGGASGSQERAGKDGEKEDGKKGGSKKKKGGSSKHGSKADISMGGASEERKSQEVCVLQERWSRWWSSPYCGARIDVRSWFVPVGDVEERLGEFDAKGKKEYGDTGLEGESYIRRCVEEWTDDELTTRAYLETDGLAGIGGAGIVMTGAVGSTAVAIKYWNREVEETKLLLRDEMLMYCWLASTHKKIMGRGIPKLVAVGEHYWVGAILVTELVGEGVGRDSEGRVTVGGKTLEDEDKDAVCEAAGSSLGMLHGCGVRHGDVELRNLRVARMRRDGKDGGHEWHAWWIDLGLSRLEGSAERLSEEAEHCRVIFDQYYIEEQ